MTNANHPTRQEKETELRLYMVVRSDLALTRSALAEISARTTWRTLMSAMAEQPARFDGYDAAAQPKIGLRVKSPGHLERALRECLEAGLPATLVTAAPGVPAAVGIGPVSRSELPPFVAKLQMLPDAPNPEGAEVPRAPAGASGPKLWLVVRRDAEIPFGKLAAQAGHGAWGALGAARHSAAGLVGLWDASGSPVAVLDVDDLPGLHAAFQAARAADLPAAFITDAGRTVFGRPTSTVVGIGPCEEKDLPPGVREIPFLA